MSLSRPRTFRASALLSGLWLLASLSPVAPAADDLARPIRGETPMGAPIQFLGTNSCSANACHSRGNFRGSAELSLFEPKLGWESLSWSRFDPHVDAFAVLSNDQSKRIEQNLRKLPTADLARPEQDGLCLSCHVHQNFSNASHGPDFAVSDGVGCESCHGASQLWNSAHYQAGWEYLSPEQKASYGFVPLDSLTDRARSCVSCHVGSTYEDPVHGLVDVNHDLIAAGHPRLNFEFASYHAQYPRHWSDVGERLADPSYEARAWVVGQLAAAESSLRLLRARADRSETESMVGMPRPIRPSSDVGPHAGPWPEFAEYNCYACHHDLIGGVPLEFGAGPTPPGQLPWGPWYTPMTEVIARELPPPGGDWSNLLDAINAEMTQPLPDTRLLAGSLDQSIGVVDGWLNELRTRPIDADTVDRLMGGAVDHLRRSEDVTWDLNAQGYLALAALHAAQGDLDPSRRDPAMAQVLDTLLARIRFKDATNSPPEYLVESLDGLLSAIRPRVEIKE